MLIEQNKRKVSENKQRHNTIYNLSVEAFDKSCLVYYKGTKGEPDYRRIHYCPTQAEFKQRNSLYGNNYRFIGNMALIAIYEYWENSCRNLIAEYLSVKPAPGEPGRWMCAEKMNHEY